MSVSVNKELLAQVRLEYDFGMTMENGAIRQHADGELGITRIVRTPKTHGRWGSGKVTFVMDDSDEMSRNELIDAIAARPDIIAKLEARLAASKEGGR